MYLPKNEGGDFTPAPAGSHAAICVRVIDLGTQIGSYGGKERSAHKILITWELPLETMDDGKPFTIGKRYTFSTHKKAALRADLEAWRGKPFDEEKDFGPSGFSMHKLLLVPAMLTVVQKPSADGSRIYANVQAVGKLAKGMSVPANVNPPIFFDLDQFDPQMFASFSEGLRTVIAKSPEYARAVKPHDAGDGSQAEVGDPGPTGLDDDIPF